MKQRRLGNSDLYIAPLVLGGNVFGWTIDEQQSFAILDSFVEKGFNAIDTADSYSRWAAGNKGGESEAIIGKWMKARRNRERIMLATKVGSDMGQGHKDISEKYILQEVDQSLKRLQVDYIDLYFTHWDDNKTPVEETLSAYDKLIKGGKVRWIGASNLSPERLKASLDTAKDKGLPKYQVFQPEYNLYDRQGFEQGVAPICKENNIGVISYYSLASGFLSGKYRSENDLSKSVRGGGVKKYLDERGMRILHALDAVSSKHNTTQSAIALAWLMHKPAITAPIASATKESHVQSFVDAAALQLDGDDMQQLDEASAY